MPVSVTMRYPAMMGTMNNGQCHEKQEMVVNYRQTRCQVGLRLTQRTMSQAEGTQAYSFLPSGTDFPRQVDVGMLFRGGCWGTCSHMGLVRKHQDTSTCPLVAPPCRLAAAPLGSTWSSCHLSGTHKTQSSGLSSSKMSPFLARPHLPLL